MSKFDWLSFVQKHNIEFVTRGPNVAAGNIAIKCPFCGTHDPSQHMGLSLDAGKPSWGCLRDSRHRGRNPTWLIVRLIHCGVQQAKEIVEAGRTVYSDDLRLAIARLRGEPDDTSTVVDKPTTLRFPNLIKPIDGRGYSPMFLDYLQDERGFIQPYDAVDVGNLHYCMAGKFKHRVVFPIYQKGKMVTYVGRDITGRSQQRYLALDKESEVVSIKDCLYGEDELAKGGDCLFATEGPFDALKFNCYLPKGFFATCLFGMPTPAQITKLLMYAPRWNRLAVLLDSTAQLQSFVLHYDLSSFAKVVQASLPQGVKDPGALRPREVRQIVRSVLQ